jgi:hypothetical protein
VRRYIEEEYAGIDEQPVSRRGELGGVGVRIIVVSTVFPPWLRWLWARSRGVLSTCGAISFPDTLSLACY